MTMTAVTLPVLGTSGGDILLAKSRPASDTLRGDSGKEAKSRESKAQYATSILSCNRDVGEFSQRQEPDTSLSFPWQRESRDPRIARVHYTYATCVHARRRRGRRVASHCIAPHTVSCSRRCVALRYAALHRVASRSQTRARRRFARRRVLQTIAFLDPAETRLTERRDLRAKPPGKMAGVGRAGLEG